MAKSSSDCGIETPDVEDPDRRLLAGPGPFRANVAALVIRLGESGFEVLLGERGDTPGFWQWPQGGMETGESETETLRRELLEEVGLSRFRVLHRFPVRLRYYFPADLYDRMRPNIGQIQRFFLVAPEEEASLERATENEFSALSWFPLAEAAETTIWFKKPVYRRVIGWVESAGPDLLAQIEDRDPN